MIRSRQIVIVGVIVLLVGLPFARAESDPNTKLADRFVVTFVKSGYPEGKPERVIKRPMVHCRIDVLNPDLVLGISDTGIITQFENDKGKIINIPDQVQPTIMPQGRTSKIPSSKTFIGRLPRGPHRYEPLMFREGSYVPSKDIEHSAMKISQWIDVLKPARLTLELEPSLLEPESERINHLKGYFHVLMAESIEYVEIPFEPNDKWQQVTPAFEIKVLKAQSTDFKFKYNIETRKGEGAISGPHDPWSDLPNRFPIEQQWIDKYGNAARSFRVPIPIFPLHMGGSGSRGEITLGCVEKIRYVIAVNASQHKIPFELEDIPLPTPPVAATVEVGEKAVLPNPADGAVLTNFAGGICGKNLSWKPGDFAASYDVYFGDNFDDVNEGTSGTFRCNQKTTYFIVGYGYTPNDPLPDGFVPGTTYYWRIDEVNDTEPGSPWKGNVWSFSLPPTTAHEPSPADGSTFIDPNVDLSWEKGLGAIMQTLYFGDDFDTVSTATTGGTVVRGTTTYDPGPLELDKSYYWRVDTVGVHGKFKGDVWSFTVNDKTKSEPVSYVKKYEEFEAKVEVAVAKTSLPAMTVITPKHFVKEMVSKEDLPEGQPISPARVIGRVLAVSVVEGQILTESCFVQAGSGAQLAAALPHGMRAVTVSLPNKAIPDRALLYPGCVVDVLVSFKLSSKDSNKEAISTILLREIQVLAIQGESVVSNPEEETKEGTKTAPKAHRKSRGGTTIVTLMVNRRQAEALSLAIKNGSISLTIRNPLDRNLIDLEANILKQGRLANLSSDESNDSN